MRSDALRPEGGSIYSYRLLNSHEEEPHHVTHSALRIKSFLQYCVNVKIRISVLVPYVQVGWRSGGRALPPLTFPCRRAGFWFRAGDGDGLETEEPPGRVLTADRPHARPPAPQMSSRRVERRRVPRKRTIKMSRHSWSPSNWTQGF